MNIHITHIEISSVDEDENADTSPDPLQVFINKVEALSDLLSCTEEQAEKIIFDRL